MFLMFISICFKMISYMNGCCTFRDCGIRGSRCRRKDTDRNDDIVRYCECFFVSSNASSKHCLPGGNLQLPEHSKVGDLKILALKSLRQGFLKLITAKGHVLTNPEIS